MLDDTLKAPSKVRLAIIGARGIANYGGFESYVAELAPRLVKEGVSVTCSCEKDGDDLPREYKGVRLQYFPIKPPRNYTLRKIFEVFYDIYFILRCDYDTVYGLNCNAGPFYLLPRLIGKDSMVNIDGMDWVRTKYNWAEQFFFRILYYLAEGTARRIAIDSQYMRTKVPPKFRHKLVYAPMGVDPSSTLHRSGPFTLGGRIYQPGSYWLVIARLEPENNIEMMLRGFASAHSPRVLLVVGNFTSQTFKERMRSLVEQLFLSERVFFTGGIYDPRLLDAIRTNCFAYIHGHSVGGTNPSLLEIMAMGKLILAFDTGFNREVGEDSLLYFDNESALMSLISKAERELGSLGRLGLAAYTRIATLYDWNNAVQRYVEIIDA